MGDEYRRLESAFRFGQISRRTFLRRAVALGALVSAQAYLPVAAASDASAGGDPAGQPGGAPLIPIEPPEPPEPTQQLMVRSVAPLAGAVAGGFSVRVVGAQFQPGATVAFGSAPATSVTYESATTLHAIVPAAAMPGSVTVTVVNPDGRSAALVGGFTYVAVNPSEAAQVLGIAPLAVLEGTESEIVIRGRNLISAYNQGFVALRGPSRAQISVLSVTTGRDEPTGIEALTVMVRVVASPALAPQERLNIQVLASTRAAAAGDGVVESSSQMFTVLPRAIPVPLAYTAGVSPGQPNLVVVAGRNLAGCTIDVLGAIVHTQQSDDGSVAGIVSFDGSAKGAPGEVLLLGPAGALVGRFALGQLAAAAPLAPSPDPGEPGERGEPLAELSGALDLALTPVPGQQFHGPTAQDSAIADLRGGSLQNLTFNWANFEITIIDITIILPIINEVRLVPFFDGGGSGIGGQVLAQAGKLLRLRGMGLLLALRVEIVIHIEVVLIIGFIFEIWPYGLYNEFYGSYGWAIGSIVIGIRIEILIIVNVFWMAALVLPNGQLRVLSGGTLQIGIDFTISADGRRLVFDPDFIYEARFSGIGALQEPSPCGDLFQLAVDGGQSVFPDAFGGYQSFYFARAAGQCCVPWDFNMALVRFSAGGGDETTVQGRFRVSYCLTATPSESLIKVIVTSVPPPTGAPPTLVMALDDTATIIALAQPVDAQGSPTGPAQDVRDLGYGVEFFLPLPPQVLEAGPLLEGAARPEQTGDNLIVADLTSVRVLDDEPALAFWPGAVVGFSIVRALAEGEQPRLRIEGLPVRVNPAAGLLRLEPVIAYRASDGRLVPAPLEGDRAIIERAEPFEAQRTYLLAVRVLNPREVRGPQVVTLRVAEARMLLERNGQPLATREPLAGITRAAGRQQVRDAQRFFSGGLVVTTAQASVAVRPGAAADELIEVSGLTITPNHVESPGTGTPDRLVPPGRGPRNRDVALWVRLEARRGDRRLPLQRSQPKLIVRNEETFEEYLRVMAHVPRALAGASAELRDFPAAFAAGLATSGLDSAFLNREGARLWGLARAMVQSGVTDDRPLYYARLQALAAMRAYQRRSPANTGDLPRDVRWAFELPSRGLSPGGMIQFDGAPAGARKAIVTGYDPFELLSDDNTWDASQELPDRSNSSGLAVLGIDGSYAGEGESTAFMRGAIFPLHYDDFDDQIVENAVRGALSQVALIMTTSMTPDGPDPTLDYYDVDRFATRYRALNRDNNNKLATLPTYNDVPGERRAYFESTLPYQQVISVEGLRVLSGPGDRVVRDLPFVINQGFHTQGVPHAPDPGGRRLWRQRSFPAWRAPILERFQPQPFAIEREAFALLVAPPDAGRTLEYGGGGNFFSNEVFYRVATLRRLRNEALATGHLHIPGLGNEPLGRSRGALIVRGVQQALGAFLRYSFPLGSQSVVFRSVRPGQAATAAPVSITNVLAPNLMIAPIDLQAPFSAVATPSLPATLALGQTLSVTFTFAPTEERTYQGRALVRDVSGAVVAAVQLVGTGIAPTPLISSFTPLAGFPGVTVVIRGLNLDGASAVRIHGEDVPFSVVDSETVRATVTEEVTTGLIEVVTPRGTAASETAFRRFIRPNR